MEEGRREITRITILIFHDLYSYGNYIFEKPFRPDAT
jgi:hypothetical protein